MKRVKLDLFLIVRTSLRRLGYGHRSMIDLGMPFNMGGRVFFHIQTPSIPNINIVAEFTLWQTNVAIENIENRHY